jgi:hypothetical protein
MELSTLHLREISKLRVLHHAAAAAAAAAGWRQGAQGRQLAPQP